MSAKSSGSDIIVDTAGTMQTLDEIGENAPNGQMIDSQNF